MPASEWASARARMMLDPEVANLNTGSFGPLPRPVFDRVTQLRTRLAEEPMDFLLRRVPDLLWRARERLAAHLETDPRRLIFTTNVTASINLVASSLPLSAPGEILLTDHEYGAMHWCWERAARRLGLTLRTFALPTRASAPEEIVASAVAAMTPRTRLFFFSHVLSPTGLILPARRLCEEARARGILTVVDGAHSLSFVPLNLAEIPFDFYGGNCHKWLLAPTGSGFLVLGSGSEDRLQPLQVSWGYHTSATALDQRDEFGSTPRIRRLEFEGTRDVCPWLAVPEAIAFQQDLGFDRIRQRQRELSSLVRQKLNWLPSATPDHPDLSGAMTAYELRPEVEVRRLREFLWNARVEVPIFERCDRLLLRVSTHFYNTEEELARLADVLPKALA